MNKVRYRLGVGLCLEHVAGFDELVAQWFEILDDAIVHDSDIATRHMGVGIGYCRLAMGCPARVCDAKLAFYL